MKRLILTFAAVLFFHAFLPESAKALEPRKIPDITVTMPDGAAASASTVMSLAGGENARWLLIYVSGDKVSSPDPFISILESVSSPALEKIAVIAGGVSVESVLALISEKPVLTKVRFYADTDWSAHKALPSKALPVVYGLKGDVIEWAFSAVSDDSSKNRSILTDWVK